MPDAMSVAGDESSFEEQKRKKVEFEQARVLFRRSWKKVCGVCLLFSIGFKGI